MTRYVIPALVLHCDRCGHEHVAHWTAKLCPACARVGFARAK